MSQTSPNKPKKPLSKPLIAGLVLIAVLSLAFAGYTSLNPHAVTVTQQHFLTNTQSFYNTQTVTSFGTQTVTSLTTATKTGNNLPADYYQYCNVYNCIPYPAPPGYYDWGCYTNGSADTVQCSGYLYKDANGCIDLLVPISNGYWDQVQQYYYLRNLPASPPSPGTHVTVTGQLAQGYNAAPNGGSCPSSYINVSSMA